MMWGWGAGGWLGGLLMMLFWAGLVLLIVWAVQGTINRPYQGNRALDILEERFARGEIDASELAERRLELIRS
jgi:putative membrane protein